MTSVAASSKPRPAQVPDALIGRLKEIVGPGNWIDDPAQMGAYTTAWRDHWDARTPLVVRPGSTAEVAAIVAACAAENVPVVPQSGNTGLTGGGLPRDTGAEILLTTERMRKVRDLDLLNDTITVEAGVILADIQKAASDANRLFPLSLGAEGSCRIGGNLSTNAGGVQVLRYGNARALVLGLEVVLPDGRVWNGLRGLRKDNTGYDLKQMFIGAEGTLGIITAAVLRLYPKPTERQVAVAAVTDPAASVRLLGLLREEAGEQVTTFELLQRSCYDNALATLDGAEDPLDAVYPWYVLTELNGQGAPGSLRAPLEAALARAFEAGLVQDAVIATSEQQANRLWRVREEQADVQKRTGTGIKHDVSVPLSRIAEFIERADAALTKAYPGIRLCAFGHVGDGNIHYNPIGPVEMGAAFADETEAVNRIVHDIVADLDGSISAEHGIGRLRLAENERYKSEVEQDLMRAVKQALDPLNLMNPGKLISERTG